jgi:hypothetical protein
MVIGINRTGVQDHHFTCKIDRSDKTEKRHGKMVEHLGEKNDVVLRDGKIQQDISVHELNILLA